MGLLKNLSHKWHLRMFLDGTRQDIAQAWRSYRGVDAARVRAYLATHAIARLQIGAGFNARDGWLNTNWFPVGETAMFLDATKPFALPDASFDYVFSEHVIEHLPEEGGANLIRESYRILKPGGKLRISTPDINFLVRLLGPNLSDVEKRYIEWVDLPTHGSSGPSPIAVVNKFVREWGHMFIYDPVSLTDSLRAAGFVGIAPHALMESDDPELAGMENVGRMPEGFLELETMTFEATKPLL